MAAVQGTKRWPDLCGCCDPPADCATCLVAACCPCVLAGQNHDRAGLGGQQCCKVGSSIGTVVAGAIVWEVGEWLTDYQLSIVHLLGLLLVCIGDFLRVHFLWTGRQDIAEKYNMDSAFCPGCLCVWCCQMCALIQEFKVVVSGGWMAPSGAMTINVGQVVGQPVGMSPVGNAVDPTMQTTAVMGADVALPAAVQQKKYQK